MAFHATAARIPRARRLTRIRARFDSAALRAVSLSANGERERAGCGPRHR